MTAWPWLAAGHGAAAEGALANTSQSFPEGSDAGIVNAALDFG